MLSAASGYATVALFGKWIFLKNLPLYMILTWRFGGAAIVFALLSKIWQQPASFCRKEKRACFLLGLFCDLIQTTLFFLAVAEVGASIATLLLFTFPLFVFLLQQIIFKQQATPMQWLSLGMALLGVLLIVPTDQISLNIKGILCGLGTAITYAIYLCYGAHFTKKLSASISSTYLTTGAFSGFAILTYFTQDSSLLPASATEWLTILSMIAIATVIPLLCLMRGMKLLGAAQSAMLFTIEPVITIFFAALLFKEPLTIRILSGSTLILLSALLLQRKNVSIESSDTEIV